MDYLIDLLSEAINVDLSKINGAGILSGNISHIDNLMMVLYEYSKILLETRNRAGKVQTDQSS